MKRDTWQAVAVMGWFIFGITKSKRRFK